jgi:hypothetical protein
LGRVRELALRRAHEDAEDSAWAPGEAVAVETSFEHAPTTPAELQRVATARLEGIQHGLLHDDFSQGRTLQSLPDENEVQKWIADRLQLLQGRSYSVERESDVVDEKEPDIRLRAKASDAILAIEIKVAESWTLQELEDALVTQLCGRYLRAREARYGVLVLVHQQPRSRGWRDPQTGAMISFTEVVAHLQRIAAAIAGTTAEAPQPVIAVLDVSTIDMKKVMSLPGVVSPSA